MANEPPTETTRNAKAAETSRRKRESQQQEQAARSIGSQDKHRRTERVDKCHDLP